MACEHMQTSAPAVTVEMQQLARCAEGRAADLHSELATFPSATCALLHSECHCWCTDCISSHYILVLTVWARAAWCCCEAVDQCSRYSMQLMLHKGCSMLRVLCPQRRLSDPASRLPCPLGLRIRDSPCLAKAAHNTIDTKATWPTETQAPRQLRRHVGSFAKLRQAAMCSNLRACCCTQAGTARRSGCSSRPAPSSSHTRSGLPRPPTRCSC